MLLLDVPQRNHLNLSRWIVFHPHPWTAKKTGPAPRKPLHLRNPKHALQPRELPRKKHFADAITIPSANDSIWNASVTHQAQTSSSSGSKQPPNASSKISTHVGCFKYPDSKHSLIMAKMFSCSHRW